MLEILAAVMFDPVFLILSDPLSLDLSPPLSLPLLVSVNQNEPRKENITESIRPRFWCATRTSSVDPV